MARAVVLGVNGQDGSYAAEALLASGHDVFGIGRQPQSRYVPLQPGFEYKPLDLANTAALATALKAVAPDYLFHFAAIHGPNSPAYEATWPQMLAVNVLSLHTALEYARTLRPELRIAYANSSKIFGSPRGHVDEDMGRLTNCLYSNTKNSAFDLIRHYREKKGVLASNLIFYNHESVRRPRGYFVPDLLNCLSGALVDPTTRETFHTLDFFADWSDAEELTGMAVQLAEVTQGMDVILASGRTVYARDMVDKLFARHGMDYRRHIQESIPGRATAERFDVSTYRLRQTIGRVPQLDITTLMERMLPERLRVTPEGETAAAP